MRVFLDANVLFSASHAGSNIARLVNLMLQTGEAVTSDLAREEARRNILLKRPAWSDDFDGLMRRVPIVQSAAFILPVTLDEKDAPILCAAIHARCQYFVTGDRRDFGHLYDQCVSGVTIITLVRLAEIVANQRNTRRKPPPA